MKYLSSAVDFAIKNWMLIIPVFVLLAISGLIQGAGDAVMFLPWINDPELLKLRDRLQIC